MRKWIENSPVSVGIGLIVIGLIIVFLAWNGAASRDFVEGQIPYLISGGIGGLAVVGGGIATIIVQAHRADNAQLVERLDQMIDLLRESGAYPSSSGPTVVPDDDHVLAGSSTFHLPSCRVVEGRDDYRPMRAEDAESRGLTPCRVCQPDIASA